MPGQCFEGFKPWFFSKETYVWVQNDIFDINKGKTDLDTTQSRK